MSKRTVIKADEELVIKGKLTVEGNVTQIETTEIVNRLESNSLVINSDGENVTAELTLNSNGTEATMSFNDSDGAIKFNQPVDFGSGDITTTGNITGAFFYGNARFANGIVTGQITETANLWFTTARARESISVSNSTTSFGNVGYSTSTGVISFTGVTTSEIRGTFSATTATGITYDSANGVFALASIPNSSLTNSSITDNGYSTALGGTVTLDTDDVDEGSNLYFTNARVRAAISHVDAGGDGSFAYDSANGVFTYTGPNQAEANARMDAYLVGGDGIDYTSGTIAVDSTVVRTSGNQSIAGDKTFTGTTYVTGNIEPTAANTYNLGSWANHFNYVFANVLHAEYLDLEDANIADIHNSFYVGSASSPIITRSGYGLTFTHNTSGAYYEVNAGDGLQISGNNVAVDNTVVRTTGDQTITGNIGINGTLTVAGTINSQNVEDTYVKDTKITLNANAAVDNTVSIEVNRPVAGTNTYIKWDESTDQWKFSNNGSSEYLLPTSTTDLAEGANLYYTSARANNAMDAYLVGGAGLTYSSGTFAVGAGTGITVNADDVAINASYIRSLVSVTDTGGDGSLSYDSANGIITYTGPSASEVRAHFSGGDGIDLTNGIIDVDSTVIRTTGNQNISGIKNFTGELVIPSSFPTQNNTIYVNAGNTAVFANVNGVHVQLTSDSDVGQVEDVGATGINIYAGSRDVVLGNNTIYYHGIKSIDVGSYLDISESANVITVAGNATGIRGLISATGNISYDSANGIISENLTTTDIDEGNNLYFTAARARGNISGTGLINYSSSTGVISTTADNYGNWNVQTDSGVGATHSVTSNSTVIVSGGSGITVTNTGGNITIASTSSADIDAVTAGDGLTGGGISGAVTLNVGAGAGITVNADNIALTSGIITTGAKTYGTASQVVELTVDTYGRVTSASNLSISITASQVSNFTSAANSAIDARVSGGDGLTYSSGVLAVGAGTGITVNPDNVAVNISAFSTTDLAEGANLYYTAARANAAMDAYLVADGGLSYTNGTFAVGAGYGILVGSSSVSVSNTEIRALFTGSDGISYNSSIGAFTLNSTTAGNGLTYSSGVLAVGAGAGITVNADNVALSSGVVTAGAYSGAISAITVDTYGRVTSVTANAGYTTNTGTVTSVTGGNGLTGSITTSGSLAVGAGSYIIVNADDVAVDATSTNTANKVVARDASGNFAANVITATATSARYADLAENYLGDADYLPGVVLVFGGAAEVTACTSFESTRVAGVVTTQPAHVMNSDLTGPNVACIALRGRVPVQVKGVVRKGDVLVTAGEGNIGYAVASLDPRNVPAAAIVGKAITDKLDPGPGTVEALI